MPDLPVHSEPADHSSAPSESTPKQPAGLPSTQSVPQASPTHPQPSYSQAARGSAQAAPHEAHSATSSAELSRDLSRSASEDGTIRDDYHGRDAGRTGSHDGFRGEYGSRDSGHNDDPLFRDRPRHYSGNGYDDPYSAAGHYAADEHYGPTDRYGSGDYYGSSECPHSDARYDSPYSSSSAVYSTGGYADAPQSSRDDYGRGGLPLDNHTSGAYAQDAPVYSSANGYGREGTVHHDPYTAADHGEHRYSAHPEFADTDHYNLVDAALTEFSQYGFNEARLERIALASGMSKRMIHYYYGDKKGLYIETLRLAATLLRPNPETMVPTSNVPVDAMRELVDGIVEKFFDEPRAARVLALENLLGILPKDTELGLFGQSPMVLEIDRLLMLGQDYGAFRPGVSAIDIYLLISALSMFPVYNQYTFRSMYGVTIGNESNREGLRMMVQDVVISFLTTMMPSRQGDSYTVTTAALHPAGVDAIIFDDGKTNLPEVNLPNEPLGGSETLRDERLRDDRIVNPEHEREVDQPSTNPFDQQFGLHSSFYED